MFFFTNAPLRMLALASIVVLSACSKKDDPAPVTPTTPTTPTTAYSSTWTADGTNYTATTSTSNVFGTIAQIALIQPSGNSNYFVSLTVPAAVGTYTLGGTNSYAAGYTISTGSTSTNYGAGSGFGGSGTINVTTFSTTEIIGTFSFVGDNPNGGASKAITNGKFAIKR